MDLAEIKNALASSLEKQYQDELKAVDNQRRLADEAIGYTNEARGTYYSGMPTWQRAQSAASYTNKIADLANSYANKQVSIGNKIDEILDQINSYNEAASLLGGSGTTLDSTGITTTTNRQPIWLNGRLYKYENGRLVLA